MSIPAMSDRFVARLAKLDTCAVSDSLDRARLKCVALGLSALSTNRRIAGTAVTVQLGPDDGRTSKRHLCTAAVDASGPGSVIVISHNGRIDVAGWGGILSKGAKRNAIEGVIIDGACRDVDESRELDLPIYGRAVVPVTARGRILEIDWNVPIDVAGVRVAPGDLVLADASGVVFVPFSHIEEVLSVAEQIVAKERLMAAEVDRGRLMAEVMGANYEALLSAQASSAASANLP
jgi:4-hydroxy-4-methyl-2-oxoglutarate aldolase